MPPRPRTPQMRSVRTPEALAALTAWLESFDTATRKRGLDYYKGKAVDSVSASADHLVNAKVTGSYPYSLTLFYTRGAWSSCCSCPVGIECKHAYAAGLAWIHNVESGARDGCDPGDSAPAVNRLQRDGWTLRDDLSSFPDGPQVFEKAAPHGWTLRKYCHAGIDHPEGKGVYYDRHALMRADSGETLDRPDWEWADLDGKRLVWTEAGRLHTAHLKASGLVREDVLHDFTGMTFEALAAPY